jgi:hypothetical protein
MELRARAKLEKNVNDAAMMSILSRGNVCVACGVGNVKCLQDLAVILERL